MSSAPVSARAARRFPLLRVAVVLLAVIAIAVGLNSLVAAAALRAGAGVAYPPLTLPVYGAFTVIGVIAGWIGWRIVQRRSTRPRAVLSVLVPVLAVASFAPDGLLLLLRFIPGTGTTAVMALMAMHVVVVGVAVPGYAIASRRMN